jgi:hypothetical protein
MHLGDLLDKSGCRFVMIAGRPFSRTHGLIDILRLNLSDCGFWKWGGEQKDRVRPELAALTGQKDPLTQNNAIRILQRSIVPLIRTRAMADFRSDVVGGPLLKISVGGLVPCG